MYVDFYDILHHDQTNTYNMTLSDTGDMPTLQFAPRRKRPLTESEWCSAWDDFLAVHTIKNPQSLCELITYSKTIKYMMRSGSDWRRYDQQFRLDRQHNKCSWAAVRVDLQIAATLANNNRNNQSFQSFNSRNNQSFQSFSARNNQRFRPSHGTHAAYGAQTKPSIPVGFCFEYHCPNTRCTALRSTFKHTCP